MENGRDIRQQTQSRGRRLEDRDWDFRFWRDETSWFTMKGNGMSELHSALRLLVKNTNKGGARAKNTNKGEGGEGEGLLNKKMQSELLSKALTKDMRKIVSIIIIFVCQFWMNSCSPDENLRASEPTLDQILGGKEMAVYKSVLTFKDAAVFNKMAEELSTKDIAYIRTWEKGLGFKSASSIYEDAIEEEDKFLATMVKKYGENSEVTRNEIGFSELTQKYLDKGILSANEEGILNINVMIPILAPLVNEEGLVRVGNEIRQYKYNYLKIILDADYNKISRLSEQQEGTEKIHVAAVERQQHEIKDVGRTKALSSCESIVGSHRLIAYEEKTAVDEGGSPCKVLRNDYYIKLRSLKKILGTWQNFKTSQFNLTSDYCLDHLNCDFTLKRNVVCFSNHGFSGGYWHTADIPLVTNYDTGPCVSRTANCTGIGHMVFSPGRLRRHLATGVNGTACGLP